MCTQVCLTVKNMYLFESNHNQKVVLDEHKSGKAYTGIPLMWETKAKEKLLNFLAT